jgi:SpoVK/Ycf46/Vps4 family AAA+-type ATPase
MSRFFGVMQTWLNDHTSDAFVVCTSNDISTLPAAFTRAERFDRLFYVGLPGVAQRRAIWRIYIERYGLDPAQPKPVDADFSGAEIKACCRLAALLDVPLVEASQNVVLVARTAHESVERLRQWASGRCLIAKCRHLQGHTGRGHAEARPHGPARSIQQLMATASRGRGG